MVFVGEEVVFLNGVLLKLSHGAKVQFGEGQHHNHYQGEQGVEIKGDGGQKQAHYIVHAGLVHLGGHRGGPAGDRGDDAHRGRCGVQDVGQLGPGDAVAVGDRAHDGAHCEAIEVVVNKNHTAQGTGDKLRRLAGLDPLPGPGPIGCRAACLGDHHYQGAQNSQEQQDVGIGRVAHFGAHNVEGGVQSADDAAAVDGCARDNTDYQGGDNLLCNQRQHNGDEGWKNGEDTHVNWFHRKLPFCRAGFKIRRAPFPSRGHLRVYAVSYP